MLKVKVKLSAGHILKLLIVKGKLSLHDIKEVTNYEDSSIIMAIGWLLKEEEIIVYDINEKLFIEAKNPYITEMYY